MDRHFSIPSIDVLAAAEPPEGERDAFIRDLNARWSSLPTETMLADALLQEFAGRVALVSSFGAEAAVLLHLVAEVNRATPVLFVDTGKLFGETQTYRTALVERFGLRDVRIIRPAEADVRRDDSSGTLWMQDPDACCYLRKVAPLERVLDDFPAWINGRKRFHGGARAALPLVEIVDGRIKLNPLAQWSAADIATYFRKNALPAHPLVADGFRSIGCMPCSDRSRPEEDARAGRWRGRDKTECGIHGASAGPSLAEE